MEPPRKPETRNPIRWRVCEYTRRYTPRRPLRRASTIPTNTFKQGMPVPAAPRHLQSYIWLKTQQTIYTYSCQIVMAAYIAAYSCQIAPFPRPSSSLPPFRPISLLNNIKNNIYTSLLHVTSRHGAAPLTRNHADLPLEFARTPKVAVALVTGSVIYRALILIYI